MPDRIHIEIDPAHCLIPNDGIHPGEHYSWIVHSVAYRGVEVRLMKPTCYGYERREMVVEIARVFPADMSQAD